MFTAYQRVTIEKGEDERNTSKVDSRAFTIKALVRSGNGPFPVGKMLGIA